MAGLRRMTAEEEDLEVRSGFEAELRAIRENKFREAVESLGIDFCECSVCAGHRDYRFILAMRGCK